MFTKIEMAVVIIITTIVSYRVGFTRACYKCLDLVVRETTNLTKNHQPTKGSSVNTHANKWRTASSNELPKREVKTEVGVSWELFEYLKNKAEQRRRESERCENSENDTRD